MKKTEAYITAESFGSDLPDTWQQDAALMNAQIDDLPEDEFGQVDRDDVDAIWERYCATKW